MTDKELMQQAVEALEAAISDDKPYIVLSKEAITAIKEALAQPEQEPVAFICQGNAYMADDVDEFCTATHIPLYTKPPQRTWVGLTKDEVDSWELPDRPTVFEFAQFIESKLKERNT